MWLKKHGLSSRGISDDLLSHKNCAPYKIASKQGSPKGPVCALYLGSYQVIPKRNYHGAHGQSMLSRRSSMRLPENPPAPHPADLSGSKPAKLTTRPHGRATFEGLEKPRTQVLSCSTAWLMLYSHADPAPSR